MVACAKCNFYPRLPGSPYCADCDKKRWRRHGITFAEYKKKYLNGRSDVEILLEADSVLLDYWYYKVDPDHCTPILEGEVVGDYAPEHKPLKQLFVSKFGQLFYERMVAEAGSDLSDDDIESINISFYKFHAGIQRLLARGGAFRTSSMTSYVGITRAWQLAMLMKKCLAAGGFDSTCIDDIRRQFDPGSALFMLELFVQMRDPDHLWILRWLRSAKDDDVWNLLKKPVLLQIPWEHQTTAFEEWQKQGGRGVVEMATATGKTLVGLLAIEALYQTEPQATVRILSHSLNLLHQWRREVITKLGLFENEGDISLNPIRIDEFSIEFNTVQSVSRDPDLYPADLLIADEVHHFASPEFKKALTIAKHQALGLSATIEGGERPVILKKEIGPTVYRLTLASALEQGIIPSFQWFVRPVDLDIKEKEEFSDISKKVADLFNILRFDSRTIRSLSGGKLTTLQNLGDFFWLVERARYRGIELPDDWKALQGLVLKRRWVIHRSQPRMERAIKLVDVLAKDHKVIVFTMDIESVESITNTLQQNYKNVYKIHSEMKGNPFDVIEEFRKADNGVLVGARMLDEGINIPDADIGISVASSKTQLQLIQRMGRVLRRSPGKKPIFFNFVAIPGASVYVGAEDNFTLLDDLAWIQETALRMNLDLQMLDEHDPIWKTASEAESDFARRYAGQNRESIKKIGTFNLPAILERFSDPIIDRLVPHLAQFAKDHRISDREWTDAVRIAFDKRMNEPLNIPGFWWLLVLADRLPGPLIRLFRPEFNDDQLALSDGETEITGLRQTPTGDWEKIDEISARAVSLYQKQKYGDAIALFDEIISLQPWNFEAHGYKGLCLRDAGDSKDAIEWIQKACMLSMNPYSHWNSYLTSLLDAS